MNEDQTVLLNDIFPDATGDTVPEATQPKEKKSQATILIEIGRKFDLFHSPDKDAYARNGRHVYGLRTQEFREMLNHSFFKRKGKGCNAGAIADALCTLEAIAKYERQCRDVYLRVANLKDVIYIDIGCDKRRVIEITADGWRIIARPPVIFIRKRGFAELPAPVRGGDISALARFLTVGPEQRQLIAGFILTSLAGVSPFPVMVLQGEQGTGKSTTCRVIRSFIDPSTVPLRSPPREPRDLIVSAINNYCVVLDNLSGLSPEISDCLCRMSTGGGHDARQLYSDTEQVLIDVRRPVMVNGIDDIATRPDLAERAFIINLPEIDKDKRKSESEFWGAFDKHKGEIFGGILDAIAAGLKHISTTKLVSKPRMADAALWVTACEKGFTPEVTFMAAHAENQTEAAELTIEASPVGTAIMMLMDGRDGWTGKPTDLLSELSGIAGERQTNSRAWPQSPKGLKNIIKRLNPSYKKIGIQIEQETSNNRLYTITNLRNRPKQPPYPPEPPEPAPHAALSENPIRLQPPEKADNRLSIRLSENPIRLQTPEPPDENSINSMTQADKADKAVKSPYFNEIEI